MQLLCVGVLLQAVSPEATAFVHRDKYWLIGAQFILPAGQSQFVKEGTVAAAAEFARYMISVSLRGGGGDGAGGVGGEQRESAKVDPAGRKSCETQRVS